MRFNGQYINQVPFNSPGPAYIALLVAETLNFGEPGPFANQTIYDTHRENFTLTALTPEYAFGGTIRDFLNFVPGLRSSGDVDITLSDTIKFSELVTFAWDQYFKETLQFVDYATFVHAAVLLHKEILKLRPSVPSSVIMTVVTRQIIKYLDTTYLGFKLEVRELLQFIPTLLHELDIYEALDATLQFSDSVTPTFSIVAFAKSTLTLKDKRESKVTVFDRIADAFRFALSFRDGEDVYAGWAINLKNSAVSRYTNYNFNSFYQRGKQLLAAAPDGVYALNDSESTEAVVGSLLSGQLDFGAGYQSRIKQLYLGVASEDRLIIKTISAAGQERWYESRLPREGQDTLRTKIGKGVKMRYWQVAVESKPGKAFDLDNIELYPVVLTRRIR